MRLIKQIAGGKDISEIRIFCYQSHFQQFRAALLVAIVFLACIIPVGMVWDICDVFMAVMGIFNIIALFMLYKYVVALYKDYRKQKAAGIEDPVFDVNNWDSEGLDTSGISVWTGHSRGDE